MSYDLTFWRQEGSDIAPPSAIYGALQDGEDVDGLLPLPVEPVLDAIAQAYPTATRGPGPYQLVWVSDNELDSFQVECSAQHVCVTCRHVHSDDMNRIIDIVNDFGTALYDPQVDTRFE